MMLFNFSKNLSKTVACIIIFFVTIFILLQNKFGSDDTNFDDKKYIGCIGYEGGLGNQIWRIASLYGIGRDTGRQIFFEKSAFKDQRREQFVNLTEFSEIFPLLKDKINVRNPKQNIRRNIPFANDCCKYESPKKLQNFKEQYLQINGEYLQSYKFFHGYQNEIKEMLECEPKLLASVKEYSKNLFQEDDDSFKLCVHIRRGDFLREILLESKEEFVNPAIEYAFNHLKQENKKISLIFIGNDPEFVQTLNFSRQKFHKIYSPNLNTRGEDMCFGINVCDSMLLTASGSTFGWWIAYLMKSNGPVFYNSQVTDFGNHSKDIYDMDAFLPNWIMFTSKNGKIKRERKWWHERNNNILT